MKKIILIVIVAMLAITASGQNIFNKRIVARDTIQVQKAIIYPDGTIGNTGFLSGDTAQLSTLVPMLEDSTDTYVTPTQLSVVDNKIRLNESINRVYYISNGYRYYIAVEDSVPTSLYRTATSYYPLNEISGNAIDSVSTNDLTNNGATQNGNYYTFASTDYVGGSDILKPTTKLSISAWFRTSSTDAIFSTITANYYADYGYKLAVYNGTGKIYFETYNSPTTSAVLISTAVVNDGNWHHVVATYDGSNLKMYIDNTLQTSQPAFSSAITYHASSRFYIGRAYTDYMQGDIKHVAVWTAKAISADYVDEIFNY